MISFIDSENNEVHVRLDHVLAVIVSDRLRPASGGPCKIIMTNAVSVVPRVVALDIIKQLRAAQEVMAK